VFWKVGLNGFFLTTYTARCYLYILDLQKTNVMNDKTLSGRSPWKAIEETVSLALALVMKAKSLTLTLDSNTCLIVNIPAIICSVHKQAKTSNILIGLQSHRVKSQKCGRLPNVCRKYTVCSRSRVSLDICLYTPTVYVCRKTTSYN